jgi:hypothetical protein
VNTGGFSGTTPLFIACNLSDAVPFVKCLLDAGANANATDEVSLLSCHILYSLQIHILISGLFFCNFNTILLQSLVLNKNVCWHLIAFIFCNSLVGYPLKLLRPMLKWNSLKFCFPWPDAIQRCLTGVLPAYWDMWIQLLTRSGCVILLLTRYMIMLLGWINLHALECTHQLYISQT